MQTNAPLWGLPDPDTQAEFYADVPIKRLIAWVIDVVLIALISFLIGVLTLGIGLLLFAFVFFAVGFIYRTVSLANRSATPGMRMAAIQMRNNAGERFDTATAALHTLGYYVSVGVFPLQIVSIVLMLTGARRQGLTDMVLGTAAINRGAGA